MEIVQWPGHRDLVFKSKSTKKKKKRGENKMAIRWIKNVLIDGEKSTVEIQIGDQFIGDKAYTRINQETESWFNTRFVERIPIINQGLKILQERLAGKSVKKPDGSDFEWSIS